MGLNKHIALTNAENERLGVLRNFNTVSPAPVNFFLKPPLSVHSAVIFASAYNLA